MLTYILILTILVAFVSMTRGWLKQEVAMPLVALIAVTLSGARDAEFAIREGFAEFSRIAVIFTAVAVPAHLLQRAGAFDWMGMLIGEWLGTMMVRFRRIRPIFLIPAACLFMAYTIAAVFHNTTSILVSASIIIVICKSYKLHPLPILCGALVASNAGGFSTRWGDTPNITEAAIWQLTHRDFFREILPINIGMMILLSLVISIWLIKVSRHSSTRIAFETTYALVRFRNARRSIPIDRRLLFIGAIGLAVAILLPMFTPAFEIQLSCMAIVFCCLADRQEHRKETLLALGVETYATLCAIFVLSRVLTESHIGVGQQIKGWLENSGMSIWAISSASYLGTLLTEAASWASAASPIVYAAAPTNVAAWALGAGICAGSSSLVTAATAGIILTRETKNNNPSDRVTFGSYVLFGISFSLLMLTYYIVVLSIIW